MLGLIDAAALQLPETFTAAARAADDAGAFHDAQVFADGLTGDAGAGGEAGDGHRAAVAEPGNEQWELTVGVAEVSGGPQFFGGALRLIEGAVGGGQQFIDGLAVLRENRDSRAYGDGRLFAVSAQSL